MSYYGDPPTTSMRPPARFRGGRNTAPKANTNTEAKNRVLTAEMKIAMLEDKLCKMENSYTYIPPQQQPQKLSQKDQKTCNLCFDREIDATFSCGHTACYVCALRTLDSIGCCAFCKKEDVEVIRLYLD